MMVSQMNFSKFITAFGNYRSFLINRSVLTNCTQVSTLKTESKEKLKILPEKPKKPATTFFLYAKEHRDELKQTHPNLKTSELSTLLAKEWSKLDASVKAKYEAQYNKAMNSYLLKYLEYNSKLTDDQKHIIKEIENERAEAKKMKLLRKTLRDLHKPKRPKGAFIYFALEYYEKEKASGIKFQDFLKKSKPLWENLSKAEKHKFEILYANDKKRYDLEMDQWEQEMIQSGHEDLLRKKSVTPQTPIREIKRTHSYDAASKSKASTKSSNK